MLRSVVLPALSRPRRRIEYSRKRDEGQRLELRQKRDLWKSLWVSFTFFGGGPEVYRFAQVVHYSGEPLAVLEMPAGGCSCRLIERPPGCMLNSSPPVVGKW